MTKGFVIFLKFSFRPSPFGSKRIWLLYIKFIFLLSSKYITPVLLLEIDKSEQKAYYFQQIEKGN